MKTLNCTTMLGISKVSGVCLAMLVGAMLMAPQLLGEPGSEGWHSAWMVLGGLSIAGVVLPLGLIHAGLAGWVEESIDRVDALREDVGSW